mmetsp:Transcript_21055/g.51836  ORF Transcript_21055/g.51836 Transcript_21055/m.51836 type:complete len:224 (-) Transcript_21055:8-679(-)
MSFRRWRGSGHCVDSEARCPDVHGLAGGVDESVAVGDEGTARDVNERGHGLWAELGLALERRALLARARRARRHEISGAGSRGRDCAGRGGAGVELLLLNEWLLRDRFLGVRFLVLGSTVVFRLGRGLGGVGCAAWLERRCSGVELAHLGREHLAVEDLRLGHGRLALAEGGRGEVLTHGELRFGARGVRWSGVERRPVFTLDRAGLVRVCPSSRAFSQPAVN